MFVRDCSLFGRSKCVDMLLNCLSNVADLLDKINCFAFMSIVLLKNAHFFHTLTSTVLAYCPWWSQYQGVALCFVA